MNDFGNGFDWNGNGHRDIGDSYIDYEISNGSGGGSGNNNSGGSGDGCFTTIGAIAIILVFLYLLGSCS